MSQGTFENLLCQIDDSNSTIATPQQDPATRRLHADGSSEPFSADTEIQKLLIMFVQNKRPARKSGSFAHSQYSGGSSDLPKPTKYVRRNQKTVKRSCIDEQSN